MLRKETKEVVCKYCNKVFKTRKAKEFFCSDYCRYEGKKEYLRQKAKEYYKKLKKSKRQNQENILLIKKATIIYINIEKCPKIQVLAME